uniref:Uncharacterized protein n=1 Tax=Virgibacillus oceani TaxID=1479511 RepID=A0A917HEL0_9BACI|nr:hypothetical protein GCM10011398_21150 [Virgibacillus oceani]
MRIQNHLNSGNFCYNEYGNSGKASLKGIFSWICLLNWAVAGELYILSHSFGASTKFGDCSIVVFTQKGD